MACRVGNGTEREVGRPPFFVEGRVPRLPFHDIEPSTCRALSLKVCFKRLCRPVGNGIRASSYRTAHQSCRYDSQPFHSGKRIAKL
jgi:hypothetical protein